MDAGALRASWAAASAEGDRTAELFYAIMFTLDPDLRAMFPIAMNHQRDKLLGALGHIVSHVDDPYVLAGFAAQLGRDHRRFNVAERHYPTVGRALLATLQRVLGPAWSSDLARDWMRAYTMVSQLMMDAARESATVEPPWWDADVVTVERRTSHVSVLTVAPRLDYGYAPGQSIAVETALRPRAWRYLSPANAPRPDNTIEFHIRAVPGGLVSPALAFGLRPGDGLRLSTPVGVDLARAHTSVCELLLIAGGTGLAPLRAVVEHLTTRYVPGRVTFVVGASTAEDLYDLPALRNLAERASWLNLVPAVSADPGWRGEAGTATQVALRQRDWSGHEIYVCGPAAMVADARRRLTQAGCSPHKINTEAYATHHIAAALAALQAEETTYR
jgi:NAD(P)H-flavin reductase/hemoglobin-like flavoprotein